jgi:endo-1,4-beta-xylanase
VKRATGALLAATLGSRCRSDSPGPGSSGLKDSGRKSGCLVGAVIDKWQMQDQRMLPLILENFNLITLGKLKWGFVRPTMNDFDFGESDWMVEFCGKHGLAMHGHNLCWNAANPAWLIQTLTKTNARQMLTTHIDTVMKRYAGRISSWDVVNEPIAAWMGRDDGLYKGPWLDALGESYIDLAFHTAAAADPKAVRVLNVAHVEQAGGGSDAARTVTLRLIEGLLKRGVPLQAIGFESHLSGAMPGGSSASRARFVESLLGLGLEIILTEVDVDDTRVPGNISERDVVVADCYSSYLSSMLPQARPKRVIFFSFCDLKNWIDGVGIPAYTRQDGAAHRPGLFSQELASKPAYAAALAAFGSHRS